MFVGNLSQTFKHLVIPRQDAQRCLRAVTWPCRTRRRTSGPVAAQDAGAGYDQATSPVGTSGAWA